MPRIAIFAGAFNPIHAGHMDVIQAVLSSNKADRVLLLPSSTSPYAKPSIPVGDLIIMCRLSIMGDKKVILADEKPLSSDKSIIDTVYRLKNSKGKASFVFIVGADKLAGLLHWSKVDKLFELCTFLVYPREGYNAPEIIDAAAGHGLRAELLHMLPVKITSAMIRTRFSKLQEVKAMLDPRVEQYIAKNGLYQTDFVQMIRPHLNQNRFKHTLGVRNLAVDLALRHQIWMQGAAVASLFHDCAKEMKLNKMQALIRYYKEDVTPLEFRSTALLHGKVAATLARYCYGIDQEDVLNAIRFHTTGRANMSPLELSVFVADKAEIGRKAYPGLREIRKLMYKDLDQAALFSMKRTKEWIKQTGFDFSADSQAGMEALENKGDSRII